MSSDEIVDGLPAPAGNPMPARGTVLGVLMRIELVAARFENAVALASLAVAAVAMATSVVIRALNLPIPDPGEWALVAMAPLTFVGGALCSHLHKHLTADIIEALDRGPLLSFLEGIVAVLFVAFGVYFVTLAANLFEYAVSSGEQLIDLGTPIAVPVGFMLIGAVLITFHAVLDLIRAFAGYEPGGFNPWH